MVARGRNSTSHNHCAIDRSIGVRWHGADQFLASRNIHGTFKQTWFALFVKTTLSLRYGGVDVTRCIRVPACQMILAVLDHALHADNTSADRVDLATSPSLSSRPATGLSALAPAQRAGAQRLCAMAPLRHADRRCECLFIAVDRKWSIRGDFCAATGGAGSDMAGAGVARAGQSR